MQAVLLVSAASWTASLAVSSVAYAHNCKTTGLHARDAIAASFSGA